MARRRGREPADAGFFARVYGVARQVPYGRVTTYGAIARALGEPLRAREVGWAMASLPAGSDVPAHRVVGAGGELKRTSGFGSPDGQRRLLESEGVRFTAAGRVAMAEHYWEPGE